MDNRIILVNAISKDILENNKDNYISSVIEKVKFYDDLFEELIKNFYEIKCESNVPLFELCEHIRDEEHVEKIAELLLETNKMFDVCYTLGNKD